MRGQISLGFILIGLACAERPPATIPATSDVKAEDPAHPATIDSTAETDTGGDVAANDSLDQTAGPDDPGQQVDQPPPDPSPEEADTTSSSPAQSAEMAGIPLQITLDAKQDCRPLPPRDVSEASKTFLIPQGVYQIRPVSGAFKDGPVLNKLTWHFNYVIGALDSASVTTTHIQGDSGGTPATSEEMAFNQVKNLLFPLPSGGVISEPSHFTVYIKDNNCADNAGQISFMLEPIEN